MPEWRNASGQPGLFYQFVPGISECCCFVVVFSVLCLCVLPVSVQHGTSSSLMVSLLFCVGLLLSGRCNPSGGQLFSRVNAFL